MNAVDDMIVWIYILDGNFDTVIFALPFIILITFIYWVTRLIWHRTKFGNEFKEIRKKAYMNETIRLLTVCWFCALLSIVLTPTEFWFNFWRRIIIGQNPFEGFITGSFGEVFPMPIILQFIIEGHHDWLWWSAGSVFPHLLLNILLFVPLGVVLPFIYKHTTFIKTVLIGVSLSFLIEFIQFFIGRSCETDDLICNTLGAAVGYCLYLLIGKLFPKFTEKCRLSVYDKGGKTDV